VYTTLQPELETIRAEREGEPLPPDHATLRNANDKVISDAITQDLKEAKDQVVQPGGFAWGIRQWLFDASEGSGEVGAAGKGSDPSPNEELNKPKDAS